MAKLDTTTMFDPITVILGGQEYTVRTLTTDVMDKLNALSDRAKLESENSASSSSGVIVDQLALLLSQEPATFHDVDVRILVAVVKFLTEEIGKALGTNEVKNSGKVAVVPLK